MKKNLLFTSAMALFMASCTQAEFEQLDATSKGENQGVAFAVSTGEDAETRAAYKPFQNVFDHEWYADQDKIGVFYKAGTKVKVESSQTAENVQGNGWIGLQENVSEAHPFEFKATASGTSGYFVANGDKNTLWLSAPTSNGSYTEEENPVFRAFWPYKDGDFASDSKITIGDYAKAAQTQTTTDGHGIAENAFMVSESKSETGYNETDNSVARDRFKLTFKRISPIIYFKIKTGGADNEALNRVYRRDYAEDLFERFGNLKTVELTAEGSKEMGTSMTASDLTFNSDAKWDIAAVNVYDPATAFEEGTAGNAVKTITLTLGGGSGLAWSDDAVAFMNVANVDRTAYRDAEEKETVTAEYTFEKIKLETSVETDKDWKFEGDKAKWIGFPTEKGYNLDDEPYIAYEYSAGVYALEVNPAFKGKLKDLFEGSNLKGIKKGNDGAITKNDIKHFVSKVNITEAGDFAVIKSLANLTNVTLLANTTVPAKAFEGLTNLVYLNLPEVTTVEDVNAFPGNDYTDVYMGSYDFSDKEGTNQTQVRDRLLKQANLVKADISAVANIAAGFPTSGVIFTGFDALEEITVKPGVVIGGAAFKGCEQLKTVQFPKGVTGGSIDVLEGANSQFMDCAELESISISNTVVADMAFKGCTKLETVLGSNGKAIVPTAIGISSFESCKAIVDMDLSQAATIGEAAFKECTALVGNNSKNAARTVLYVNAVEHVSKDAFNGCSALEYISFAKATTIGTGILTGATCTEIEFLKPFTVVGKTTSTTNCFGTTTGTKLFCAKDQKGVLVNTLTYTGDVSESEAASEIFGNGITKYAE